MYATPRKFFFIWIRLSAHEQGKEILSGEERPAKKTTQTSVFRMTTEITKNRGKKLSYKNKNFQEEQATPRKIWGRIRIQNTPRNYF